MADHRLAASLPRALNGLAKVDKEAAEEIAKDLKTAARPGPMATAVKEVLESWKKAAKPKRTPPFRFGK